MFPAAISQLAEMGRTGTYACVFDSTRDWIAAAESGAATILGARL